MSISLAPAGLPEAPRAASDWVRGTALPAVDLAARDLAQAGAHAAEHLTGVSGTAYAAHVRDLVTHVAGLRQRLLRAADLSDAYADRLLAHRDLLDELRRRAVAAGLELLGDQVLPPVDTLDVRTAQTWRDIGAVVLHEHGALRDWVRDHLEGALDSFDDEDLVRWVRAFAEDYASTLISSTAEGVLTKSGQLATRLADHLARLSRVPGPVGLAYDAIRALEGEEPAEGLFTAGVGFATGAVAVATLPVSVPTAAVVAVATVATVGGGLVAQKAWDRLPDDVTDTLDEAAEDAWDSTRDWADDRWEDVRGWLPR